MAIKWLYFYSFDDVIVAYKQSVLSLHTFVWVRSNPVDFDVNSIQTNSKFIETKLDDRLIYTNSDYQIKKDLDGNLLQIYVKTTPGRILLNQSFEHN